MSIKRAADAVYTFRFIRNLTMKWEDMPAYDLGIIDENGAVLKKASTLKKQEEKDAYTVFHRLVFNIKRLLEKLPFGKSKLVSYAAALFLLKENTEMSQEQIESVMDELFSELDFDAKAEINESTEALAPGVYRLTESAIHPKTGEAVIPAGSKVMIEAGSEPVATFYGVGVYEAYHISTGKNIYVAQGTLEK